MATKGKAGWVLCRQKDLHRQRPAFDRFQRHMCTALGEPLVSTSSFHAAHQSSDEWLLSHPLGGVLVPDAPGTTGTDSAEDGGDPSTGGRAGMLWF